VTTEATDMTADAPAKTAAGAETSDVTATKATNATAGTAAKTTDVTAAKAPAASSATTAAGVGCYGDERHHEEQHRRNADAGLEHRFRTTGTGEIRSCRWRPSRDRMKASPRSKSS
jgi:type IV secretory pathway TrbL component